MREHQRGQFEGSHNHRRAVVAVQRTQHGRHVARLGEAGEVLPLRLGQGADQVHRGVALSATGCNRRSEEHTSELQSLMRISYAVFCLKKKNTLTYALEQ